MPLIKSKSKQAFEHNVKAEIESGKPVKQSLAIAYNTKKQASKKKYAKGGKVESAATEKRPMPEDTHDDAKMVKQNNHMKSNPSPAGSMKPVQVASKHSIAPIKHPRLMGNPMFKVRDPMEVREEHLMESMKPKYAKGGMINEAVSMHEAEEDMEPAVPKAKKDNMRPDMDEYMSDHEQMLAQGGEVSIKKEMYDQPEPEAEEERHASLAAAIMAKRKKMAEGGEVDLSENAEEQPNMYYKLNKKAVQGIQYGEHLEDKDQPMDSNLTDDPREEHEENDLDMISAIRRKMAKKHYFGE